MDGLLHPQRCAISHEQESTVADLRGPERQGVLDGAEKRAVVEPLPDPRAMPCNREGAQPLPQAFEVPGAAGVPEDEPRGSGREPRLAQQGDWAYATVSSGFDQHRLARYEPVSTGCRERVAL